MQHTQVKNLRLGVAYLALTLAALLIIIIGRYTSIDINIADYYYSPALRTFAWRNSWFAQQLMHIYVKDTIIFMALIFIGFVVMDVLLAFKWLDAWARIRLRFVAISAILTPSIISGLKQSSPLHCPWDEQRYGGTEPYLRLFDAIPAKMEAGHCFPAGHASTGLWLAAICVFWLPHRPRIALMVFLSGLTFGFVLGWVQQMRGAHFLTHTLASVWVASAITLIMLNFSQPLLNRNNTLQD